MKKSIVTLLLCGVMVLGLAGCGDPGAKDAEKDFQQSQECPIFSTLLCCLNKCNHIQWQCHNPLFAHTYVAIHKFVSIRYIFVIFHQPF